MIKYISKLTIAMTICIYTFANAAIASDVEPSEDEMYRSFLEYVEAKNEGMRNMWQHCRQNSKNLNTVEAYGCLAMVFMAKPMQMRLNGLRKVACASALIEPGFQCDYIVDLKMDGDEVALMMNGMMPASRGKARFVNSNGYWHIIMPE